MSIAADLREAGRSVDLILEDKKMKWAFRYADNSGASRFVLLAPDEWQQGLVKIRDLGSGEEQLITAQDIVKSAPTT